MFELPITSLMGAGGLACGLVMGATARGARFCTFGAIEDWAFSGNLLRIRAWVLAMAVAMVLVQILHTSGIARIEDAIYLAPRFGWLGAIVGGLIFGLGMALVGTCGYGVLVRLGGGDMRAFVALLVLGLSAYMTARGLTALARIYLFEIWALNMWPYGGQGLPHLLGTWAGVEADRLWLPVGGAIAAAMTLWCFRDPEFRKSRRDIVAGVLIGTTVTAGFLITGALGNDDFDPQRVQSLTYVLPPGEAIQYLATFTGATITFGIGLVFGTILGSLATAVVLRQIRLEAFDDAREMRRHLFGAFLMGFGGVSALGCTIGQGITGMSTLSLSAPLAFAGILAGARLGIAILIGRFSRA